MSLPKWIEPKVTVGNVIQLLVILFGGLWTYFTLVDGVADAKTAQVEALKAIATHSADISSLKESDSVFNTRMAIVESRAETQATEMGKMGDTLDELQRTTQGLVVTSATTKTDVGYIRDWVEELKRREREARGQ